MKFLQIYKKELLAFCGCFFLFLIISFISYSLLIHEYKLSFLSNNAFVINYILKLHPELESEIMESFKDQEKNYDTFLLSKYGFQNEESLSNLSFVSTLEQETMRILLCSFLLSFFLFLGLVFVFYFQKAKRIQELDKYLFQVLNNNYQVSLKDYREDGLSSLKSDLLKVTNKLRNISEMSLEDKKNLERTLSDISHQLRTPLTSLTIINDVLKTQKISKEETLHFLEQQRGQLERMEWLIVALLKMSQIDSGTIVFVKKQEYIKDLLEEALKPSLIPLELKQIHYEVKVDPNLLCTLDFHWTVEALVNLIKNAMEHTSELGKISIIASDNPMYVEIIIEDNGSGISKKDLPHIFERFYKGNSKTESIGIGLNLSKSIIEKQNGTIHVESEEGKGTRFIIHFYKVTV